MTLPAPVSIPPVPAFGRQEGPFRAFCREVANHGIPEKAYRFPEPVKSGAPKAFFDSIGVKVARRRVTETGERAPEGKSYAYVVRQR